MAHSANFSNIAQRTNRSRVGAAFTDRIKTERRWKFFFLVNIGAMAFFIMAVLVHSPKYTARGQDYASAHQERLSSSKRVRWMFNTLSSLCTITSLAVQMSLYWSERSNWGIGITVGLCLGSAAIFLGSLGWLYRRKQTGGLGSFASRIPAFTTRNLSTTFFWGASYHTLVHYLRKFTYPGKEWRCLTVVSFLAAGRAELLWASNWSRIFTFCSIVRLQVRAISVTTFSELPISSNFVSLSTVGIVGPNGSRCRADVEVRPQYANQHSAWPASIIQRGSWYWIISSIPSERPLCIAGISGNGRRDYDMARRCSPCRYTWRFNRHFRSTGCIHDYTLSGTQKQ